MNDAFSTYERSVALEDVCAPSKGRPALIPGLKRQLAPELLNLLQKRQDGTRAVARSMIDRVLLARAATYSAASAEVVDTPLDDHERLGRVFDELPDDTGHLGAKYFEHLLNPLHRAPPDYVLGISFSDFAEEDLARRFPESVAGIVVVHLPSHESAATSRSHRHSR